MPHSRHGSRCAVLKRTPARIAGNSCPDFRVRGLPGVGKDRQETGLFGLFPGGMRRPAPLQFRHIEEFGKTEEYESSETAFTARLAACRDRREVFPDSGLVVALVVHRCVSGTSETAPASGVAVVPFRQPHFPAAPGIPSVFRGFHALPVIQPRVAGPHPGRLRPVRPSDPVGDSRRPLRPPAGRTLLPGRSAVHCHAGLTGRTNRSFPGGTDTPVVSPLAVRAPAVQGTAIPGSVNARKVLCSVPFH